MLQQIFLFLADYTVICVQSLPLTVVSDTLSGKLMDGNFGCLSVPITLTFPGLLISMIVNKNMLAQTSMLACQN